MPRYFNPSRTNGLALAATLASLSGSVIAETPVEAPANKPHLRFIVMDSRFDIKQEGSRSTIQEACTALGKVSLVANQRDPKETTEQVVDCFYFKPGKKKSQLMHMQFYQLLSPEPVPETGGVVQLNIKVGFVPVKEILAYSQTAKLGTFLLSDKPLKPEKEMAATLTMGSPDCSESGCNTVAKIPDLDAFFKAGGIDTERASAWQMVLPPQLYVMPPERVTALSPQRPPYRASAMAVSFSR